MAVINDECSTDPNGFAAKLERGYFEKYFGKNPDVQALARRFLSQGNRAAAKEWNLALKDKDLNQPDHFKSLVSDVERKYFEMAGSKATESNAGEERTAEVPRRSANSALLLSLKFLSAIAIGLLV